MAKQIGGNKKLECSQCKKRFELGADVVVVERSVVGPRGVVPLGETEYFCSEDCLVDFYSDQDLIQMDRRIP